MPKIPTYEAQSNLQNITSRIPTESGMFDTITDPGAVWKGIGSVGQSIQDLGNDGARVVYRINQMNDYDVRLALESRVQKNETEAIGRITDIEGKTGDDRIKAIDEYDAWKNKVNIFDLGNINSESTSLEQKLKKSGITEEQKTRAWMRMQDVWNRYDPHIARLKLEAREFNAVRSIQDSTNTAISDLDKGIVKPDVAVQRIIDSVAEKDLSLDKAHYLIDSNVQFATKTYLERELGKNNPEVIKDVIEGKYDKYLVGIYYNDKVSSVGHNLITDFKDSAQKKQSINKANTVYTEHISNIKTDPFSKEVWENTEKEILGNSELTIQEKSIALDALRIDRNKEQVLIREDREAGKLKESQEYYNLVNNGDYKAAREYLENVKYLSPEDVAGKKRGLDGIGSEVNIKTLLDIKTHIMENPTDIEVNKKLIYDNIGSLGKEAESLLTLALSNINDVEAKTKARSYKFIESQVAPHNSLLGINNTPGENDNLKKAFDAFDDLYQKVRGRDADKFVDSKTMDDISRYVIEQYKPTLEQQAEWKKESIKGDQSRFKGESIKQYEKRVIGIEPNEADVAELKSEAISFLVSYNEKPELKGKKIPLTDENIKKAMEYLKQKGRK